MNTWKNIVIPKDMTLKSPEINSFMGVNMDFSQFVWVCFQYNNTACPNYESIFSITKPIGGTGHKFITDMQTEEDVIACYWNIAGNRYGF